jgi:flagellar biosynthesis anti-sigma factor FlgM
MRIDGNSGSQPLPQASPSANQAATGVTAQTSKPETVGGGVLGEDQADLSSSRLEVQVLAAQALQFPEIRHAKVSALRQVVENGSYQPSAGQIADAMLAHIVLPAA